MVEREEATASRGKTIPSWDDLTKDQQTELAEIAVAQRKQRQPVRVTLTQKPEGGISISFDGHNEVHAAQSAKDLAAASLGPLNARANELLKYLGSVGADKTDRYNAALSFIESMAP